jgi:endo-1,3(4)-beta-glucanase
MGQSHSNPASRPLKRTNSLGTASWLSARKRGVLNPFGHPSISTAPTEIPPDNIFVPTQADSILSQIPIGRHHPVPKNGVEDDDRRTMNTNKFYANAFLGEQDKAIWTHPYSVWWGKGIEEPGKLKSMGLCISHAEESDLEYGPGDPTNVSISQNLLVQIPDTAKVYMNPLRKQSMILSAQELDQQTFLTTDTHLPLSVNINLSVHTSPEEPKITFPLVQGMSFVTAGYRDAMPTIQTDGKGFVEFSGPVNIGRSLRYRVKDMDGRDWLIYVNSAAEAKFDSIKFFKLDPNTIIGPRGFKGTIQIAKNPLGVEGEALYDRACRAFVTEGKVTAVVNDAKGTYALNYSKVGTSSLLMFLLPHHIQSLDPGLRGQITKLQLRTTTKGTATAVWGEKFTFVEPNLPINMHFGPWTPTMGPNTKPRYPPEVLALIAAVAERDLRRSMTDPIPSDSFYYAGKSLAKFASIVWVIKDVLSNESLAATGLEKLKSEMARYISNSQMHALYYDDT